MASSEMLIVIATLAGLNVFQLVYWSRLQSRLVDKLMSRNYAEYVQLSKPPPSPGLAVTLPDHAAVEEQDVLSTLNRMLGT
jgi:hypothetical protein